MFRSPPQGRQRGEPSARSPIRTRSGAAAAANRPEPQSPPPPPRSLPPPEFLPQPLPRSLPPPESLPLPPPRSLTPLESLPPPDPRVSPKPCSTSRSNLEVRIRLLEERLAIDELVQEKSESNRECLSHSYGSRERVDYWLDRNEKDCQKVTEIDKLAKAITEAIKVSSSPSQNNTMLARISACKDLPPFFGDSMEWLQFKQTFEESTMMCKFTDAENIWRLRKSLRGEAKETVSALLMGHTSAASIMDALNLRFGQPELIMSKLVAQIKRMAPLPTSYHADLVTFAVKIKNYVTAVQALKQTDYLRSPELLTTILSKCPTALLTKWADYYAVLSSDTSNSKLELFSIFIENEGKKAAAAGISHISNAQNLKYERDDRKKAQICYASDSDAEPKTSKQPDEKCKFCRKNKHPLTSCPSFKKALRRDRWYFVRRLRLCYRCLEGRHRHEECDATRCGVDECNEPHHKLLHWPLKNKNESKADKVDDEDHSEVVAHAVPEKDSRILLKVVPIMIHGPKGNVSTYALLDDGASCSLISADIAEEAGLNGEKQVINIKSAWDSSKVRCEMEVANCQISNTNNTQFELKVRIMKELNLCPQRLSFEEIKNYAHLRNKICLLSYTGMVKPKVLIGQDHYHLIAPMEILKGKANHPYATNTLLGWCVHGHVPGGHDTVSRTLNVYQLTHDQTLHAEVKNAFALEAIGVTTQPRVNPEHQRAVSILDATANLKNGRREVGLPWKSEIKLPESYLNAYRRLRSVEFKTLRDPEYGTRYRERVEHLLTNDFAHELRPGENKEDEHRIWYLPHFGVDNPNKKKLRLVFDAAAESSGKSLNDFLLQGPDLLQSLLGIMMRFREQSVGVIGDIKDMFLRVKIVEKDQNALRFLWRDGPTDSVKKYVMTSLIFGANCSPFVAQYIKNKNAMRFQEEMPEAVNAIIHSHYMDDYVDSQSEENAILLVKEIVHIHAQGGFEIRNFLSNNKKVLQTISKSALNEKVVDMNLENQCERTLGLLWYPDDDSFGFDLSLKRIPEELMSLSRKPTKRELLRIVMSIFDVYGFLAPFTVKAKIILQASWRDNTKWDEMINESLFPPLKEWISDLMRIKSLRIPRWYLVSAIGDVKSIYELHVLCDASPTAYATVAYWRILSDRLDGTEEIRTAFIASKSRVAPVKSVTVPRLELQAAILGCRLADTIQREHRIRAEKRYFWTDSTVVLHWIRNDTKKYKIFVANRLGEIDSLTTKHEWHYIPTAVNTADKATKISNYEIKINCDWLRGPDFLRKNIIYWPVEPKTEKGIDDDVLEVNNINDIITCDLPVPAPERFSSWTRLLRSTAAVLLFIEKCRKNPKFKNINADLMWAAEVLLIKHSQSQTFINEINCLAQEKPIERNSRLRKLTPYLEKENGLLRVDGRIGAAKDIEREVKNPIILDGRNYITRLIVDNYHKEAAHGFNELVVNQIKQRFWVINLRPTVRTVSSRCRACRIRRAKPVLPRLSDLPEARLALHQRAFSHCGVDLFGPMEITVGRRRERRYGVLFTCMTVRAVHIELAASLTTDSFIMALRRMASRRGWPQHMYSDNGTNLRGAEAELRKSFQELNHEYIQEGLSIHGVAWNFSSPSSPHKGGAWERMIQTVKKALKIILTERAPHEETLLTLLAEVENLVNSRPLTHVSVDSTEESLTPNHFLIGSSCNLPIPGIFTDGDLYLRKMWRTAQRLTDLFWKRWVKEMLPNLLPRPKWFEDAGKLKTGDLVVIVDPDLPRGVWPKGLITRVFPGRDGRVRTVEVQTKTGKLTRPVTKLAPLPVNDEC